LRSQNRLKDLAELSHDELRYVERSYHLSLLWRTAAFLFVTVTAVVLTVTLSVDHVATKSWLVVTILAAIICFGGAVFDCLHLVEIQDEWMIRQLDLNRANDTGKG
jgi:hypothetical protein